MGLSEWGVWKLWYMLNILFVVTVKLKINNLTLGNGVTTAFIRVCAAVGEAEDLQTMTTDAVKKGLTMAVDSGRPVVECLKEAGQQEMLVLQKEHYLQNERLK